MIRRYDLRRSDNYPYNGRIAHICSGSGTLNVVTGFPVKSAIVTFATLPLIMTPESMSSTSSSSSSSSSEFYLSLSSLSSSSSSSSSISSESSFSRSYSSSSSSSHSVSSVSSGSSLSPDSFSSLSTSSTSSTSSPSSSSTSSDSTEWIPTRGQPRLFVSGYTIDGFIVTYQNIPEEVGFIEFSYSAV